MATWKLTLGTAAAAAACAACCALPVIPAAVLGALGLSGASFAAWGDTGLALALLGLGGGYAIWRWLRPGTERAGRTACSCGPASGCNAGNACDVPAT